ncbi:substrate-binding periplasmic protein [Spirochaeta isovalerica]|uniref:Polar amino acid transport system substrate-binding protein n=1 Tax=Spirochaeta isovalerica TaxID=150 RepID=A0A841RFS5_9SPIO|nr:transporter substrate-binding domain-containing protein [Spirochaeta isovalerica]MBB6481649.1 polar amino acid transport system substrate-binding protein [Spirochaeta isovalerica]
MKKEIILFLFMVFFLKISLFSQNETSIPPGTVIYIGDDEVDGNWPPFEYFIPVAPDQKIEPSGYNIDILEIVAKEYNINFDYINYPWTRVFYELEKGESIQMVLPVSLNSERLEKFYSTRAVYQITPSYFYLKEQFPMGIHIEKPEDILEIGIVNGRVGYNYINFGLNNEDVNRIAKSGRNLFDQLRQKRCAVVLARYETTAGMSLIGEKLLDSDIGYKTMPGVEKEDFHFLITKNYPYGDELRRIINETVEKLDNSGELDKILTRYLIMSEAE